MKKQTLFRLMIGVAVANLYNRGVGLAPSLNKRAPGSRTSQPHRGIHSQGSGSRKNAGFKRNRRTELKRRARRLHRAA